MNSPLASYHLGNGLTVAYKNTGECVAHISPNRVIKYYKDTIYVLTKKDIEHIEVVAKQDDRRVSTCQEDKVFNTRPNE